MRRGEYALQAIQKELRYCAKVPVYFAQAERTGEIKIGFSMSVYTRLYSLGNQRFTTMNLLGWKRGGPAMERKMHAKFQEFALGHEWFEPDPVLMAYIETKTRHDDAPHIAPKFGRLNDTHFDTLIWSEQRYKQLLAS